MAYITNEMAYKLGAFDAYFMGSVDTNQNEWDETLLHHYNMGYASGLNDYSVANPESAT